MEFKVQFELTLDRTYSFRGYGPGKAIVYAIHLYESQVPCMLVCMNLISQFLAEGEHAIRGRSSSCKPHAPYPHSNSALGGQGC